MLKKLIPLIILLLAVMVLVTLRMTRPQPDVVAPGERSWPVAVTVVELASHQPSLPLYGQIAAPSLATLSAPVAGVVASREVSDGDRVDQGQPLLALDSRDIEPLLAQTEADVADLQAQIDNEQVRFGSDRQALAREQGIRDSARRQFERTQSLVNNNLASQTDLDAVRDALDRAELAVTLRQQSVTEHPARLRSLQARLARAESALASARRDAARSELLAPMAGVVTRVAVSVGDRVSAGTAMVSLYAPDTLELHARVPALYSHQLQQALAGGQVVEASTLDDTVRFRLTGFAGESDAAGPTGQFRIVQGRELLRPGDMVPVVARLPAQADVIAVPYSALYGNDGLYLVDEDERLQRITVTRVGDQLQADGQYHALVRSEQLRGGETLVITHLPNAINGLRVTTVAGDAE